MKEKRSFNIKKPAKASIWYLGSGILGKAVGIILTPFFTRLLDKESYGELTLYMTLVGTASVICSAVSSGSAIYKGLKDNEKNIGGFLKSSLMVSLSFSVVICLLLFTFSPFLDINAFLFIPLTVQILCDTIVAVALSSARFSYRYKEVAAIGLITSLLPALISIVVLWIFGAGFRVRIYSMLAVSLVVAAISLMKIYKMGGKLSKKMIKKLCRTSLPLVPHGFGNALSGQADKLILSSVMGAVALAKYSVVHSLGIALQFAVGAVGSALGPWIVRRLDAGEKDRIAELGRLLLSGFSALNLCIVAGAPEAIKILAPSEYLDAFPALLPIALTTPLLLISTIITVSLVHSEKSKFIGLLTFICSLIGVLLNFTLIPKLGYIGAGIALLLSQLASVILGLIFLRRAGLDDVFMLPSAVRLLLFTAAVGVILSLMRDNLSVRVLLLTIPAIMLLNDLFSVKALIVEKRGEIGA